MYLVLGAGGHAKVIIDILKTTGNNEIIAFDDKKKGGKILGVDIVGAIEDAKGYIEENKIIAGIGDNFLREKIVKEIVGNYGIAIHSSAIIGEEVSIGNGTVIMANAVINSGAHIGEHSIVNTGATIDHDCWIGDYVHISPGVHLGGNVRIEKLSWIGLGSNIKNNISIGEKVIVGAGSVVVNNLVEEGVYYGTPARIQTIASNC